MSVMGRQKTARKWLFGCGLALLLAACAGGKADPYEEVANNVWVPESEADAVRGGRITGDGITLFGGEKELDDRRGDSHIGY